MRLFLVMLSLTKLRQLGTETAHLTDEELEKIRQSFYDFGQLIFEDWHKQKFGSKYPTGSFPDGEQKAKI